MKKKAKEKLLKKFLFESLQNVSLAVGRESLTRFSPDGPCKSFLNEIPLENPFPISFHMTRAEVRSEALTLALA